MRFGVVGTGYWAQEVHAAALDAAAHTDLVAVWGRDAGKAAAMAQRFGVDAYDDPAKMFVEVDAVSFAVPPDVQAPLAVQAAGAGCHLLLEKPTGLTLEQADAVLTATRENGVASVVLFTSRFLPEVAEWLEQARATGGWIGARATWMGSVLVSDGPFGGSPWRHEKGALWDVGPHALSMTLPLMGKVTDVTAVRGSGDTVHVVLRHADGGSSTLLLSHTVPEAAATTEFAIYGDAGWEHMPAARWDAIGAHQTATRALVRSAQTGEPHPCDAAFAREVAEVLAGAQLDGG